MQKIMDTLSAKNACHIIWDKRRNAIMKCQKCGTKFYSNFCPNCGSPCNNQVTKNFTVQATEDFPIETKPDPAKNVDSQHSTVQQNTFTPLQPSSNPSSQWNSSPQPRQQKSRKKMSTATIIALVLLIIVLCIYIFPPLMGNFLRLFFST